MKESYFYLVLKKAKWHFPASQIKVCSHCSFKDVWGHTYIQPISTSHHSPQAPEIFGSLATLFPSSLCVLEKLHLYSANQILSELNYL